jgi:hypothetical protein
MKKELVKFENLSKGYVIRCEEVEEIVEAERTEAKFALKAMSLAAQIEKYFAIEKGESVTVVQQNYDMVILSDEDAHFYHIAKFGIELERMGRTVSKMKKIDVNNIPEKMIDKHNRSINVMGATYTAARNAFKDANAKYFPVHKSNKPEQLEVPNAVQNS